MNTFTEIKILNKIKLTALKDNFKDCSKYEIIDEIFKDEACFFKMSKEDAFMILSYLDIKDEEKEKIYQQLISSDYFYDLYNNNKININDKELKIKYNIYNNNIFD